MQQRSKVLLVLVMALAVVFTLSATALADDYSNHWSSSFVKDAISKGWITTDANGNIQPDAQTTRGAYALMLWKSLGSPSPTIANPFTDVSDTASYYNAVRALFEAGVTTGMTATTFGPDVSLNREMACTMLVRAHKLTPTDANAYQQFADNAQISDWARNALSVMAERKYVEGVGNSMFAPKQNLKNGEMIKIVMNVANGVAASATAAQQAAVAALQVLTAGPIITLKQVPMGNDEVVMQVTVTDANRDVSFVGWRTSSKDATYSKKDGFSDITASKDIEFTVNKNGWYAVYAENKGGYGSFKLIEVTTIADGPTVKLTPDESSKTVDEVTVKVSVSKYNSKDISQIYWRTSSEGAKLSKSDFTGSRGTDITDDKEFSVTKNGWYAVGAIDTAGVFGYHLINVENISGGTKYTVTFNKNGGTTEASPTSKEVSSGGTVSLPTAPTRTSYTFKEWNTKSNGSGDEFTSSTRVTANITVYAQWESGTANYTVTFNSQNGSTVASQTVASGGKVSKPTDPTRSGYTFGGWYKESTCTNAWNFSSDTVSGNITLYAKWTATGTTYTVTVTGGSGSGSYTKDAVVTIIANAPTSGQQFKQWNISPTVTFTDSTSATSSTAKFTMPAQAVTVTAVYEAIPTTTYTVTVTGGSGSGSYAKEAVVTIGATVPQGKRFVNWTVDSGGVTLDNATNATTTFTMPANAVKVTAVFEDIPVTTYNLTVAGGSGSANNLVAGATVTISADTPAEGKVFSGWTGGNGGSFEDASKASTTFTMPANNATVTATFADKPIEGDPITP